MNHIASEVILENWVDAFTNNFLGNKVIIGACEKLKVGWPIVLLLGGEWTEKGPIVIS